MIYFVDRVTFRDRICFVDMVDFRDRICFVDRVGFRDRICFVDTVGFRDRICFVDRVGFVGWKQMDRICRRFEPGGSLDRRVNYRRVPQPRWVGARWSAKGGRSRRETGMRGGIPRPSCLSRAQVGCACSRGLQASTREGASGLTRAPSRPSPRDQPSVRGPRSFLL
jgi:hypothetical protein